MRQKDQALSFIIRTLEKDITEWLANAFLLNGKSGRTLTRKEARTILEAIIRKAEGMLILCTTEELMECGPVVVAVCHELQHDTIKAVQALEGTRTARKRAKLMNMEAGSYIN